MSEYGADAGEINHGCPFGFLGHAGCDEDEEIFSLECSCVLLERRGSINWSGADFGLLFTRLSHRTHIISAVSLL